MRFSTFLSLILVAAAAPSAIVAPPIPDTSSDAQLSDDVASESAAAQATFDLHAREARQYGSVMAYYRELDRMKARAAGTAE
ncbi:uncharacterized protein C8Q71DRAFT_180847 [Rhodofomes roseus]|uniref:DUF4148 domain-containing protein n=1 Tax=Rhodofomes roseus TaxID=34475 RepID=A0ABQ8K7X1_9APHY|nr:uncharacterized protein C8Q71DRAFT_180847 [Rhodofomes roseus]KAH9833386.1 hypothetical protein C8Q71DRAFT_180847 [Rhodofomes roseus]